jgi:ABC-type branched-subunit amino acid transport system ATPase component/ABC-type branched-subunit amino acid transport system permease subunit
MSRVPATRLLWGVAVAAGFVVLAVWPLLSHDAYKQNVILFAFLIGVMAVGWNIISGFAGYVSLGHSAFIGIGAYTAGIMAHHLGWSPWWFVPFGGVAAAVIAVVLGFAVMRTRGHSFVILTIAFLFIFQLTAQNWVSLTGGSNGLQLPLAIYPRKWQNTPFYYALFGLLVLSVLLSWLIRRTKFGTGLIAIREDEDKAGAVGVSTPVYKLLAFAASAVFVGMAGAVYGYYLTYLSPTGMFDILLSVQCVLAALLGGRATILGPVLGAGIIETVNEESNVHIGGQLHIVVFGALMAATVLLLPRGIIPTISGFLERRRARRGGGLEGAIDLRPSRVAAQPRAPVPEDAPKLLEVTGLRKSFGGVRAVDDLSLYVREGTITGLIGPNGSGKTTAFNLIDGMMRADGGEVWFDERRIDRLRPWSRAHLGLGRTFQITRLFRQMTVLENVVAPLRSFSWRQLAADAVAGHEAERAEELLDFVGMHTFKDVQAGALSYGQQKLVELAQVLMLDPKLILLDEPAGGINPTLIERLAEKIRELNALGKTFLVVEHNMPLVAELCDPVIVLARGQRIAAGRALEIQRDPLVLDAYLGEGWVVEEAVHA